MGSKTRLYVTSSVFTGCGPRTWLRTACRHIRSMRQMEGVVGDADADNNNKSSLSPVTGAVNNPVCDPGDAFEDAAYA